jgi:hypothetical protein
MDERYVFWKCYEYTIYSLGAILIITEVSSAITGDLSSVLDMALADDNSTRVFMYQIIVISSFLTLVAMVGTGVIFCFVKIVILVWTTSRKIAKLLRTDDRQLVFALRRRMYAYLSVCPLCAVLIALVMGSSIQYF